MNHSLPLHRTTIRRNSNEIQPSVIIQLNIKVYHRSPLNRMILCENSQKIYFQLIRAVCKLLTVYTSRTTRSAQIIIQFVLVTERSNAPTHPSNIRNRLPKNNILTQWNSIFKSVSPQRVQMNLTTVKITAMPCHGCHLGAWWQLRYYLFNNRS